MIHTNLRSGDFLGFTLKITEASKSRKIVISSVFLYVVGILLALFPDFRICYRVKNNGYHIWRFDLENEKLDLEDIRDLLYLLSGILESRNLPSSWVVSKLQTSRFLPKNYDVTLPELTGLWLLEEETMVQILNQCKELHDRESNTIISIPKDHIPNQQRLNDLKTRLDIQK